MDKEYFKKEIATIANGLQIIDNKRFISNGEEKHVYHQQAYFNPTTPPAFFGENKGGNSDASRQTFRQHIINTIYSNYYTRPHQESSELKIDQHFKEKLSAANQTKASYDYNWQVYHIDAKGNAFAQKNGELRTLQQAQYVMADPKKKIAVNEWVHIILKKEDPDIQAPFFYVYSQHMMSQQVELIRFYWNIKPHGAPELIRELTSLFNKYRLPFMFKCLNDPSLYNRSDCAVLYIEKKDAHLTFYLVGEIIRKLNSYFNEGIPMFSLPLGKGVSFAEDPGKGESFGMQRSRIIADAILSAHEQGIIDKKAREDYIFSFVEEQGLDLNAFFKNPYSKFSYDFSFTSN